MAVSASQGQHHHRMIVHICKPSVGTWSRRKDARVFLGVSFPGSSEERPTIGVPIQHTFKGFPSERVLFGGDCILAVAGQPVQSAADLVYLWDGVAPGASVAFEIVRMETHRLVLGPAARRQIEVTWEDGTGPLVRATNASPNLLRQLQQPGYLAAGDLILAADGRAIATRREAELALSSPSASSIEVAVWRDWPPSLEGSKGCCWQIVWVPKARQRHTNRRSRGAGSRTQQEPGGGPGSGASLADMAPPLLDQCADQPSSSSVQMDM